MISRLPSPPRFTLPPPPMPPSDLFDTNIISQLTCSSIRQQSQQTMTSSRLILFGTASLIGAILLFTITIIWLLLPRKQKQSNDNHNSKPSQSPISIVSMNDFSTYSSRSYETISSDHTGAYLESVDTSATTCSTDATDVMCVECYRQHGLQPVPYYHIVNMPDVVPN